MSSEQDYEGYLSPFSWRYGGQEMRGIWSEAHKRRLWRRIWLAMAEAQHAAGLVTAEQVADLRAHVDQVDIDRAHAIEAEIHHDLMAELKTFAEQCGVAGGIIHLGATSTDIEDNADALRLKQALDLILDRLQRLLGIAADQIECWADTPVIGWTHLQPAEPTTLGYRLAQYGQDLLTDWDELRRVRGRLRGKGLKGAVGTSASFGELLAGTTMTPDELEARVMDALGIGAYPVSSQTYPRKQDWLVLNALAGLGGTLYKFAFDLRLLQSPPVGEWAEPFAAQQVGSSAMPFKRNPVNAENMDSLARHLAALPRVAWDNAAHSLLERTLDDSANRRSILPEAFLAAGELLRRAERLLDGLVIQESAQEANLARYGVFAGTERLLMELVRQGADRQAMHEVIRRHSLDAWRAVAAGRTNPLPSLLASDKRVLALIPAGQVRSLLDASHYVGEAPARCLTMAAHIRTCLLESA